MFRNEIDTFIEEAVLDFHLYLQTPKKEREVPLGVSLNIFLGKRRMTQRELAKIISLDDLEYMHEQFKGAYERMMYHSSNPNLKYMHSTLMNGGEWIQIQKLILEEKKFEETVSNEENLEFVYEED